MGLCKIRSHNFVRAKIFGKKQSMISKIISLRSSPHDHNEFQFSEEHNNVSFSATLADGANCARFKHIKYSHEAERWDTVKVWLTEEEEAKAWREALLLNGTPYDVVGQLCHITNFRLWKPTKGKIWCTKAVGRLAYAPKPQFKEFLLKYNMRLDELRPDQLDMMARYYFDNGLDKGDVL